MQAEKIGVYDAKNKLSQLIQRVAETGEGITITVNGEAKVDIVPSLSGKVMSRKEAFAKIRAGGVRANISTAEILTSIREGRRS